MQTIRVVWKSDGEVIKDQTVPVTDMKSLDEIGDSCQINGMAFDANLEVSFQFQPAILIPKTRECEPTDIQPGEVLRAYLPRHRVEWVECNRRVIAVTNVADEPALVSIAFSEGLPFRVNAASRCMVECIPLRS